MARHSPILPLMRETDPQTLGYGPAESAVEVVECYDEIEFEYASLRRSCVLIDQPQRGTLVMTGKDRLSFLDRMLTQKLSDLPTGRSRCAFWLNRQGRIQADLRVLSLPDRVLMDVDLHAADATRASLGGYLFTEDAELKDESEAWHRLALHGPDAARLIERAAGVVLALPASGSVQSVSIAGTDVVIDRWDRTAEPGYEFFVRAESAADVWRTLFESARAEPEIRLRPAGWHAMNIARIEAGEPMFMIDFGTNSLPAETGVIESRVSFAKGCYLGQEIVARMKSLGHPKQVLVALRLEKDAAIGLDWQPVTGTPIFAAEDDQNAAGAVTSSTISPMLGGELVAFAMMKWASAQPGARVTYAGPGGGVAATVQPSLRFWPRSV